MPNRGVIEGSKLNIVQRSLALLFFKGHFFKITTKSRAYSPPPLPGETLYNGLYEEAPLEKGYLSLIELYGG